MLFSHDTETSLAEAAALVNTVELDGDTLVTLADLDDFLARYPWSGVIRRTHAELESVRALRPRLRKFWTIKDRDEAAALVNEILEEADARPYLSRHDEWDWHLHVTRPNAPLADRIAADAAMAFLDLIRADALGRLRICAAGTARMCWSIFPRTRSATATPETAATGPMLPHTARANAGRAHEAA